MPGTSTVVIIKSGDRFLHIDPDGASDYNWCAGPATIFRSKEAAENALQDMLRYFVRESQSMMEDLWNEGQAMDTRRYRDVVNNSELAYNAVIKEMA